MIKRTIFLLSLLVLLAGVPAAVAQQKVGKWTVYPTAGRYFDDIVDGKDIPEIAKAIKADTAEWT